MTAADFGQARSDRDLVATFLERRDETAFRRLYAAHAPRLFLFLLRLAGGRRSEAEELLQETWIRAAGRLASFRWESKLGTWLFGIAWNVWREAARARGPAEAPLEDAEAVARVPGRRRHLARPPRPRARALAASGGLPGDPAAARRRRPHARGDRRAARDLARHVQEPALAGARVDEEEARALRGAAGPGGAVMTEREEDWTEAERRSLDRLPRAARSGPRRRGPDRRGARAARASARPAPAARVPIRRRGGGPPARPRRIRGGAPLGAAGGAAVGAALCAPAAPRRGEGVARVGGGDRTRRRVPRLGAGSRTGRPVRRRREARGPRRPARFGVRCARRARAVAGGAARLLHHLGGLFRGSPRRGARLPAPASWRRRPRPADRGMTPCAGVPSPIRPFRRRFRPVRATPW